MVQYEIREWLMWWVSHTPALAGGARGVHRDFELFSLWTQCSLWQKGLLYTCFATPRDSTGYRYRWLTTLWTPAQNICWTVNFFIN